MLRTFRGCVAELVGDPGVLVGPTTMAGAVPQPPNARDLGEKLKKRRVSGETLAILIPKYRKDEDAEGVLPTRAVLPAIPFLAEAVRLSPSHRAVIV